MLNFSKLQAVIDEILSLAKSAGVQDNSRLSQKHKAVTPSGYYWLFYCPKSDKDKAIPPYLDHHTAPNGVMVRLPIMVWLILQNKPIGEYAKRFLYVPRVRPHRPFMGNLLKNHKGAFQC